MAHKSAQCARRAINRAPHDTRGHLVRREGITDHPEAQKWFRDRTKAYTFRWESGCREYFRFNGSKINDATILAPIHQPGHATASERFPQRQPVLIKRLDDFIVHWDNQITLQIISLRALICQ